MTVCGEMWPSGNVPLRSTRLISSSLRRDSPVSGSGVRLRLTKVPFAVRIIRPPPARYFVRSGPLGPFMAWQPLQPVIITIYRPRAAIIRRPGSAMSSTAGGAAAMSRPNCSGGMMRKGGMKYRNATNAAEAAARAMAPIHFNSRCIVRHHDAGRSGRPPPDVAREEYEWWIVAEHQHLELSPEIQRQEPARWLGDAVRDRRHGSQVRHNRIQ